LAKSTRLSALTEGTTAPAVRLPLVGGGEFDLHAALARGPALLGFFKISCPVCQFAYPYIERIYQKAKGSDVTIVGVAQNDEQATRQFMQKFGLTFPVALDPAHQYPVSNAYGLTNVPTFFYVEPSGTIALSSVGWIRADIEEIARRVATAGKLPPVAVFRPGEDVPAWKAG